MKKFIYLVVLVVTFALMGGVAMAADNPHGPFLDNTTLCGSCHRAHTAKSVYLLSESSAFNMCKECHDGSGADCDVINGNYVVDGTWDRTSTLVVAPGVGAGALAVIPVVDAAGFAVGQTVWTGAVGAAHTAMESSLITAVDTVLDKITVDALTTALIAGNTVQNGNDASLDHTTWGDPTKPLMGGGFAKVRNVSVTSKHFNITNGNTYWGVQFGEATAPGTALATLDCVSCHLPHRSGNYRLLRGEPKGANTDDADRMYVADTLPRGADGAINADHKFTEDTGLFNLKRAYDTTDTSLIGDANALGSPDMYSVGTTTANNKGISAWCGACHDYYYDTADKDDHDNAPGAATAYYAGTGGYKHAVDVNLMYKPRNDSTGATYLELWTNLDTAGGAYIDKLPVASDGTPGYSKLDEITCLTCHRAHGTEVDMDVGSEIGMVSRLGVPQTSGVPAENIEDSMLLRLPNRGVCETCHNMPAGY